MSVSLLEVIGPESANVKSLEDQSATASRDGILTWYQPVPVVPLSPATGSSESTAPADPVLHPPVVVLRAAERSDRRTFISLSKREAVVLSIGGDDFVARLTNINDDESPDDLGDLEGVFPIDEVSIPDRPLLKVGAIFYWNIGYYDDVAGQRHRISELRFRRLPTWHSGELNVADREADEVLEAFRLT
jgi:hypothetical protein